MTRRSESSRAKQLSIVTALALTMASLLGSCVDEGDEGQPERAAWYIQGAPYARLVIELDRVDGRDIRPIVREGLVDGLSTVLDKQSIEVVDDEILDAPASPRTWTTDAVYALGEPLFDLTVPSDTVKMHVVVVDGSYSRDGRTILGLAWDHTHVVIFDDTIETSCAGGGMGNGDSVRERVCENTELGILIHELGHLLGLVDNGVPMVIDHRDEEHGHHDDDPDCVMHWLYDGPELTSRIDAPSVDEVELLGFGPNCLDDIAAMRSASDGG